MSNRKKRIREERAKRSAQVKTNTTPPVTLSPTPASTPVLGTWRSWFQTSKPTEWLTLLFIVISGIITLIVFYANGAFDSKKSEMNAQSAKLDVANAELASKNSKLAQQEQEYNQRLEAIRAFDQSLVKKKADLDSDYAKLNEAKDRQAIYVANEQQLAKLDDLSRSNKSRPTAFYCDYKLDPKKTHVDLEIGVYDAEKKKKSGPPALYPEMKRVFDVIKNLRNLQELDIDSIALTENELSDICDIESLRYLYLTNCGITNSKMQYVRFKKPLYYLAINNNPTSLLPPIREKWAVMLLDISNTKIGDEQLAELIPSAVNLSMFNADNTPMTNKTLDSFKKNKEPMRHLKIVGTKVTHDGVKSLISRTQPKYVILSFSEDRGRDLSWFVKDGDYHTGLVMTNKSDSKEREDGVVAVTHESKDVQVFGYTGHNIVRPPFSDSPINLIRGEIAILGFPNTR